MGKRIEENNPFHDSPAMATLNASIHLPEVVMQGGIYEGDANNINADLAYHVRLIRLLTPTQ